MGDSTVVRLGPGDTSDGVLSLQGSHDDVVARDVCGNLAQASVLVGIYMDSGAGPQSAGSVTVYDADRSFSTANDTFARLLQHDVLSAMNAQGLADPRRRGSARHRVRFDRRRSCRRRSGGRGSRLQPPPAHRPVRRRVLLHAEPDARRRHRASLPHRPLRRIDRRQPVRSGSHRRGDRRCRRAVPGPGPARRRLTRARSPRRSAPCRDVGRFGTKGGWAGSRTGSTGPWEKPPVVRGHVRPGGTDRSIGVLRIPRLPPPPPRPGGFPVGADNSWSDLSAGEATLLSFPSSARAVFVWVKAAGGPMKSHSW